METLLGRHASNDGPPLWRPSPARVARATLSQYQRWLGETRGLAFADYESLWRWSVENLEEFWQSVWDYFEVHESTPHRAILAREAMPSAEWFPGATLNYAAELLRRRNSRTPAVLFESEAFGAGEIGWDSLADQAAAFAATLQRLGVQPGDRVAAYLPNIPQALVAFLGTASIGAVWSLCAPDMGSASVLDRFRQISPKVLIAATGYDFAGRRHDRRESAGEILDALPSVEATIWVSAPDLPRSNHDGRQSLDWTETLAQEARVAPQPLPFDHPLWIVYSSGTTGLPKGIVHSHGGALAIGLVQAGLHWDLEPGDRFFWYSSTGWIMWNLQVMGLLAGCTICLFDGAVTGTVQGTPDWMTLWRFVDRHRIALFGAGAAFHASCQKQGLSPRRDLSLSSLKTVGSTGSPLSPESYRWIYEAVKPDVWLMSTAGGTDIAGAFLIGSPTLPVYAGEMQCRTLGAAVEAYDEQGRSVLDEVGELVCTRPMPSMPLRFWNDPADQRYRQSYFESLRSPSGAVVWRHGDWLALVTRPEATGGVIYGRSDATINRQGIRFGTSELYRVIDTHPDVLDSLAIDLEFLGRPSWLGLFVVLRPGVTLSAELVADLKSRVKQALSPRHVPDAVHVVPAIPYTLTGKKLEVPIKRLLLGQSAEAVLNRDAVANPATLSWFLEFAANFP